MTTTTTETAVALRSDDAALAERVRRLTDLAGVGLTVVPTDRVLPDAPVVLDGSVPGGLAVRVDPGRTVAADVRLPGAVVLPGDEAALLDVLVTAATPHRARTIGVVGAHGGAGASALAAVLARACVAAGAATALVDLDPAGGGLDVLLGLEFDPGRRWADVLEERGALLPERLALALPTWHLVRVLSGDRRGGAGADDLVVRSAVRALGQGHDVVVLDLPRQVLAPGAAQEVWLDRCSDVVLVSTGGVRAGAAAIAAAPLQQAGCTVHLVVRSAPAEAGEIAEAAGLPLAAVLREERHLAADVERGARPGDRRRGPLMATARALVERLGLGQ
ncbi:secretion/DNA translocation related CpaE-like protein [Georgenia soli]|uniref:Secretion/DNA translocation related CpaE-like protein n=1 Tax=Georgenia soli TaxID=638953 RepID=A0A2A9ELX8_9MICO|nr:septum site-determining protein Ssd [Georgenia soli]PFG39240.1 secretion/DNA translocation related CpaE-like protein [Georgenia soli]